jgi:hypothetical protein
VRRLIRFARMPRAEKFLFLHALFVVSAARVGLWLLPIGAIRRLFLRQGRETMTQSVAGLVWAVRAASRYVPAATCLTQALALHWLLERAGHRSKIHLGAKKDGDGKFAAHAWVECEDRVVIGGAEAQDYVPLAAWQKSSG